MQITGNYYDKEFIRQQEAPAFKTPDPDAVNAFARAAALKVAEFYEKLMRDEFPGFVMDYKEPISHRFEDGCVDGAYHFVSSCEREREQ